MALESLSLRMSEIESQLLNLEACCAERLLERERLLGDLNENTAALRELRDGITALNRELSVVQFALTGTTQTKREEPQTKREEPQTKREEP